ncbi:hypothetical protein [Helicobacter heilmannii]|uniref:hypothetical protein n=1 Tax=Helicobacter heilmannii TaxID=35817 RepID=UPI00028AB89B|nr:hypothetical protein [Helicobacter heilmannii]CCM11076.1 hypothetical protein BN341_10650 [Helicobacter heilmannii ASB1.4]CRF46582.1 hypothetical protein HHE014_15960 [Helicobacter heilmannii]CRF48568.1 hypothetical protein HHE03_01260 [Helicobacter heilmannii]BDQ26685.1 hypothetical protein ASB1_03610 [Helicobacter heilmannii]GMB95409.1 hypothetical protein NHP21011_15170 [Helicobacter heilmannii]
MPSASLYVKNRIRGKISLHDRGQGRWRVHFEAKDVVVQAKCNRLEVENCQIDDDITIILKVLQVLIPSFTQRITLDPVAFTGRILTMKPDPKEKYMVRVEVAVSDCSVDFILDQGHIELYRFSDGKELVLFCKPEYVTVY